MRLISLAVVVILANFCTGDVVGVTCPENYISINDKCLMFVVEKHDWGSAAGLCSNNGGELVTHLDDCQTYEALLWYIDSHSDLGKCDFWVGGSDEEIEGIWNWSNGDHINMGSLYWGEYSGTYEPSGGTKENCVFLGAEDRYRFQDGHCSAALSVICQLL